MDNLSGSGLPRAEQCPASYALPAVYEKVGKAGDVGNETHLHLRNIAHGNREGAPAWLVTMYDELTNGGARIYSERCFAWSPATGLGRDLGTHDRDYSGLREGEIGCTLDLLVLNDNDASGTVWDYKTGFKGAPVESLQLSHQALAAATAFGLEVVYAGIVKIDVDAQTHRETTRTLDEFGLAAEAQRIRRVVAGVEKVRRLPMAQLNVSPSEDACRYCPCWQSCPAQTTAIVQVAQLAGLTLPDVAEITKTPEAAAKAIQIAKLLEPWIVEAKRAGMDWAKRERLPLEDGGFIQAVFCERESVADVDKAVEVAVAALTPARADEMTNEQYEAACAAVRAEVEALVEVERSVSKTALVDLAKSKAPRAKKGQPGKTEAGKAFAERLRLAGALKPGGHYELKTFKAGTAAELKEAANG